MKPLPGHRPAEGHEGVSSRSRAGSLARKYSIFTTLLLFWVALVFFAYDVHAAQMGVPKYVILGLIVLMVAGALSRFTNSLLAKPLNQLQRGITAVREGRLEPVQVSRTGDEIEYLGDSLNAMIQALAASRKEVKEHQELLEQRILQRTEALAEATQRALAASRAKSEFLANMSHELRTPMNGILGMLDIVLDDELRPVIREHLETTKGCANTLLALLNDILDLSKIEAGKMLIEKIPFDPRMVGDECMKSLQARCRQKSISIRVRVGAEVPGQVVGDPLRLRQILTNLLSNAVKFTDRGGVELRIGIEPARTGSPVMLRLEVVDTGAGIAPEKLNSIFEEFTQADGTISRRYGGTGLGLAITRRLVDLHNGTISVDSEVGKGSEFRVLLPLDMPLSSQAGFPAGSSDGSAGRTEARARVLVAEDNHVNQKVVVTLLKKHGYDVVLANNGREALDQVRESAFDVVLMDIQMPEMDGIQAARTIRNDSRFADLPIIAMTAHAMNGDRERCLDSGMNGYLSKPVSATQLLDVLRQFATPAARPVRERLAAGNELPAPIDRLVAERLMENDAHLMSGMALLFLQLAPERMQRLQSAAIRLDSSALRSQAQKMERAAERIAAMEVARCAHAVGDLVGAGDYAAIQDQIVSLEREIRRLDLHMRAGAEVRTGAEGRETEQTSHIAGSRAAAPSVPLHDSGRPV